jgi:hypothetical protein
METAASNNNMNDVQSDANHGNVTDNNNNEQANATTATTENSKNSTSNSVDTYPQYLSLAKRALQKSRQSLDIKGLVTMAYGDEDNIAVLGGSDMLEGIMEGMLDKIANETVLEAFQEYCTTVTTFQDNNNNNNNNNWTVQQRLDQIDQLIAYVTEWEARREAVEAMDAKSAQDSLDKTLLPEGVSMEDVVTYREYQLQLQAKEALQEELQKMEEEISTMQEEQAQQRDRIQDRLDQVQKVERTLVSCANVCAMATN